ncbi:unnamed protein product [Kuraishia capsulata CBS 1993]|uniref:Rab-GAP TBC domain-containing protein n=1 Tax=Kuraishia capsulata CBS 1993 TaxID=1382522 RepID=W6MJB4_9ASCO|nr:uncharacterized protein KUCA_T00000465001 [Kuraishia capsulata CBS 1993]CDK24502.1 unnamed protein product [Kuraishia capsulata CBS 1993]
MTMEASNFALASPSLESPVKKPSTSSSTSSSIKLGLSSRSHAKLAVTDTPELVRLCNHYLQTKNVGGLAMIARQRGLPPALRAKAWPVLLRYHPFVINPYITPDFEVELDENDETPVSEDTSVAKIKSDLRKYLKSSRATLEPKNLTPELRELFSTQDEIFQTIERAIVKFMKKWGSIINYDSGLAWVALGLAEWIPPLPDSNYVLCGRNDIAKNGTKLRNLLDDFFERLPEDQLNSVISTHSVSSSPKSSDGSVDDPSFLLPETATDYTVNGSSGLRSPFREYPYKVMTFAEIYERLVLVILHSPEPREEETTAGQNKGSQTTEESLMNTLPMKGGSPNDRIAFFLYCLRKCLPELNQFLSEEDILNTNSQKDDWIIWWLKWCGAKAWSRYDRGRVWDMLLGWRDSKSFSQEDVSRLGLTPQTSELLGPDFFWNPLSLNNTCRPSLKPLISSLSSTNLLSMGSGGSRSSSADTELVPPVSVLDPHFELIFISVAFLKSKEFALLELEQSEIREFLNKASSQTGPNFQHILESEYKAKINAKLDAMNGVDPSTATPSLNESVDTSQHPHSMTSTNFKHRKSSRDIENVIYEAGEIWRKWLWQETVDENN